MPRRGETFRSGGYVPLLGDVVHLDWAPPPNGHETNGPQYGLVVSADAFNHGVGMAMVVPIATRGGKISGFELPIAAGSVAGVAVLSGMRSLDFQNRDLQFEARADEASVAEATRRIRMIYS